MGLFKLSASALKLEVCDASSEGLSLGIAFRNWPDRRVIRIDPESQMQEGCIFRVLGGSGVSRNP